MTDIISFEPVVARDANGDPVASATAEFYATGTTTPVTVYADSAETTPHASPLVADGSGVFAPVFKSGAPVKVVVKTPIGATLYTLDPAIKVPASGGSAGTISFAATAEIPVTTVQAAIERVQTNLEAQLVSPSLAGIPTATTAAVGTNTTQIATTAFVNAQVIDEDNFATDTATRPPSQQSTKAYVDNQNRVKAWVNFNGTGTVAIRASYNVSSITDNGVGDYTVNFTANISDANYAAQVTRSRVDNNGTAIVVNGSFAVGSVRVRTGVASTANGEDAETVSVTILR